jgi:hypothetical protein
MRRYEPPDLLLFALLSLAALVPLSFVDLGIDRTLARSVREIVTGSPNWSRELGTAVLLTLFTAIPAAGFGWWAQGFVGRRGLRLTGRSDAPHQADFDDRPADSPPPAVPDGPTTVFVPLLGEGTDVWRPVVAEPVGPMQFRLTGPVPDGEAWAFGPGTVVRCSERTFADGTRGPAAFEAVDP